MNYNRKPHILVISQYFHPETFRINDMADEWVKRGYRVTVLTGIPNYPMGKFYKGYGYFRKRREKWRGMEIVRIPLIPRGSSKIGMVLNYFSFIISGWWWNVTTRIKADLVFSFEVSPMTQVLVGCWYAKKRTIPHFLYVQDLWPENVQTVAGISNPIIIGALERMVRYIYDHTDKIFVTSEPFRSNIVEKGAPKDRVVYWPQYAEDFYKPIDRTRENDTFRIIFTGNIGTAQGLDILPVTAENLKKESIPVTFVIVGDGRYQRQLETEIEKRNVKGYFEMIPRQPAESIPGIMADCDVAFISFSDTKLWEMTIPAKLQSYMACGMPILAAANGETRRIINEAKCGICVDIGDATALAETIKSLMADKKTMRAMADSSLSYKQKYYEKKKLMDEMDTYISEYMCR